MTPYPALALTPYDLQLTYHNSLFYQVGSHRIIYGEKAMDLASCCRYDPFLIWDIRRSPIINHISEAHKAQP